MSFDPYTVAQNIIKSFRVLPTIPAAASRAIKLLNEADVDMGEVADILLTDQVLTARIIRIINSPLHRLLQEIESIRTALVYLGPQRVFELILTSCFLELTDSGLRSPLKMQNCWEHAFCVGLVARTLSEGSEKACTHDHSYIAGIIHDIGEIVLSQQRRNEFIRALVLSQERSIELYAAEMEVFGTSHAEVGALLAEQWRFPQELVEVIRYHHHDSHEQMTPLTCLIHVADQISASIGICCINGAIAHTLAADWSAEFDIDEHLAAVNVKDTNAFKKNLPCLVEQVRQSVTSIYG